MLSLIRRSAKEEDELRLQDSNIMKQRSIEMMEGIQSDEMSVNFPLKH